MCNVQCAMCNVKEEEEAKENVNNDYDNGMMVAAMASTKTKNPKAER